jgi:hypothetical protein
MATYHHGPNRTVKMTIPVSCKDRWCVRNAGVSYLFQNEIGCVVTMRPDGHLHCLFLRKDRRIAGLLKRGKGIGARRAAGPDAA